MSFSFVQCTNKSSPFLFLPVSLSDWVETKNSACRLLQICLNTFMINLDFCFNKQKKKMWAVCGHKLKQGWITFSPRVSKWFLCCCRCHGNQITFCFLQSITAAYNTGSEEINSTFEGEEGVGLKEEANGVSSYFIQTNRLVWALLCTNK